jgi:prepilin-type N-terminal cleavage/methylation domain-containing protein
MNVRRQTIRHAQRRGFTLTELLVVIMVIGILASTVLFTMYHATEQAREARAQSQIVKLHDLLMTRWDSYRSRPVRLLVSPTNDSPPIAVRRDGRAMATARVTALRDLMRMEMPDRITDVSGGPVAFVQQYSYTNPYGTPMSGNVTLQIQRPALSSEYYRRAVANAGAITNWTTTYQGAECLYLIIASIRDITGNGLDALHDGEIGDKDGDGMREILDPWGNPVEFLRWAPGYLVSPGNDGNWGIAGDDDDSNGETDDFWEAWDTTTSPGTWIPGGYGDDQSMITPMQLTNVQVTDRGVLAEPADPFNPLRIDPKQYDMSHPDYPRNFALLPLIFSAGPDGKYDINVVGNLNYSSLVPPNNPYYVPAVPTAFPVGTPMDADGDGELSFMDNITNHAIDTR